MRNTTGGADMPPIRLRRTWRRRSPSVAVMAVAVCASAGVGIAVWEAPPSPAPNQPVAAPQVPASGTVVAGLDGLLDPSLVQAGPAQRWGQTAPLGATLTAPGSALAVPASDAAPGVATPGSAGPAPSSVPPTTAMTEVPALPARDIPLPLRRPAELQAQVAPGAARTLLARRTREAAVPATAPDDRSFFERLFGTNKGPRPALAYAAPQDDAVEATRPRLAPGPAPVARTNGPQTAIYDISSRSVLMPNGERLEAHSGLGERKDDPRYVHERMKGATPPHVYELTMRERPFHGVRALRLNPVGGSAAIHGRAGLLAHSYLLGPGGDSNGCVSIRDYDRFLQAYLRGEVKRLVVVASAN
ncbi:MAG: tlde1 domain-containing protein [Alsobacter sp.]